MGVGLLEFEMCMRDFDIDAQHPRQSCGWSIKVQCLMDIEKDPVDTYL